MQRLHCLSKRRASVDRFLALLQAVELCMQLEALPEICYKAADLASTLPFLGYLALKLQQERRNLVSHKDYSE